jgi:prepilin-type N-terminal cleavage/methylation domain-containing protein
MMGSLRGYSLIEVMVAVLLFSIVAAAVAQAVVLAQRGRQISENWMRATQLASERLETVRAGVMADSTATNGIFQRDTAVTAVAGHRGLVQITVTVSWTDTEPKTFALSTLMRR